jgi:hypothetical protein
MSIAVYAGNRACSPSRHVPCAVSAQKPGDGSLGARWGVPRRLASSGGRNPPTGDVHPCGPACADSWPLGLRFVSHACPPLFSIF